MPPVTDRIIMLLGRKSEIDEAAQSQNTRYTVSYERWLVDAVQLLLELEFKRGKRSKPK